MNTDPLVTSKARHGDYVVGSPRTTDAIGHALRGAFAASHLPDDLLMLLRRLDRVTH